MVYLAMIGWTEGIIIFLGVAILFGARKIPELARSLGSSVNEFKKGMKDGAPEGTGPEGTTAAGTGSEKEK